MKIYVVHSDLINDEVDESGRVLDKQAFMRKATNAGQIITDVIEFEKLFNTGELDSSLILIN